LFFVTKTHLSEFREAVYQKATYRSAAIMNMVDALTIAGHVSSPVGLSESPLFRRKFSSVYDALVLGTSFFNRNQWQREYGNTFHDLVRKPEKK